MREVAESPCAGVMARSRGARRAELMPLGLRIFISDLNQFYATKIPSRHVQAQKTQAEKEFGNNLIQPLAPADQL